MSDHLLDQILQEDHFAVEVLRRVLRTDGDWVLTMVGPAGARKLRVVDVNLDSQALAEAADPAVAILRAVEEMRQGTPGA